MKSSPKTITTKRTTEGNNTMSPIQQFKHDLDARIPEFLNNSGISKKRMAYEWKGWNEKNANRLFQWFHEDLKKALDKKNDKRGLKMCIERILSWGGINKNKKNANMFDKRFPKMLKQLDMQHGVLTTNVIDTRLSSWTKVLAAYDPSQFCIYDSRVAIALRFLFRDKNWFIPDPQGKNVKNAANKLGKGGDPEGSYREYTTLLQKASPDNPGKYEKKLFMLGGALVEMYAQDPNLWDHAANW